MGTRIKKGDIPILPSPSYRDPAKVGEEDNSKLIIKLEVKRHDPKKPGRLIMGKPRVYKFKKAVDWNDTTSIKRLNQWREQVFRRLLGKVRETREYWLMCEKNRVINIVENFMKENPTSPALPWNHIAK
jgi:hypothetical protein